MGKYVRSLSESNLWGVDILIFVSLGTQDKSFERLLKILDKEIAKGFLKEEVIVQAGYTEYKSKNMKIFDYVPKEKFEEYIKNCDLLITHGGVGSIFTGLKNKKKVLVIPRLAKYKEQHNDHQLEITEEFTKKGYILSFNDEKSFEKAYQKAKNFKPQAYRSNTDNMISLIEDFIEKNETRKEG